MTYLAFHLLKGLLGDGAFHGQGMPQVFMTDESDAMRNAIRKIWPGVLCLLCLFHTLQVIFILFSSLTHNFSFEPPTPEDIENQLK